MTKAVGIDIGTKSLKILQLEGSGSRLKVNFFHNFEIPFASENTTSSQELIIEAIKKIFRQYHLERDNVVLSIPSHDCILREIVVDIKDDNYIKQTIKFEIERYLPSYDIDEVIVDYQKIESFNNKTKLFVASITKDKIKKRLELLNKCGIDPVLIDLDIMAFVNTTRYIPEAQDRKTIAIIDFGAGTTKIVILNKGRLQHVRAIRLGANITEKDNQAEIKQDQESKMPSTKDNIDLEIENELLVSLPRPDGINLDRMILVKKEPEETSSIIYQQKKREELFQRVIKELRRTMLGLQLENPIELVCITGGGSQLEGFIEHINKAFKVDTIFLNFTSFVHTNIENVDEAIINAPVALGMAMEMIDNNCQTMNFRKEEYVYTNRFELLKIPLAISISLFFILMLLFSFHVQNKKLYYEKNYNEILDQSVIIWERNMNRPVPESDKFDQIYDIYEAIKRKVKGGQQSSVPKVKDAFLYWLVVIKNFAKVRNHYYITIDRMALNQNEGYFEGEVEKDSVLDILQQKIRGIGNKILASPNDKTRVIEAKPNRRPSDEGLKRRYRFRIDFK